MSQRDNQVWTNHIKSDSGEYMHTVYKSASKSDVNINVNINVHSETEVQGDSTEQKPNNVNTSSANRIVHSVELENINFDITESTSLDTFGIINAPQPHTYDTIDSLSILSLNVNSLCSKLNYSIIQNMISKYDISCLQESKLDAIDEKNVCIKGYKPYFHSRKHFVKKSGGLVFFIKDELVPFCVEINATEECVQWIKLKKQLLGYDLILGNAYIPPDNTNYCDGDEFEFLSSQLIDLSVKYNCDACIVGDFNARTGVLKDYIDLDENVASVAGLEPENEAFISTQKLIDLNIDPIRHNEDKVHNSKGLKMIDFCQGTGMLIVNGRVGRDKGVGRTTCEKPTKNGITKTTNDYALATHTLFKHISDFHVDILDQTLSDVHCPISLNLKKCSLSTDIISPTANISENSHSPENVKKEFKVNWDNSKQNEFTNNFNLESIDNLDQMINNITHDTVTQDKIDLLTKSIGEVYKESGLSAGVIKIFNNIKFSKNRFKHKSPNQPWFTKECAKSRKLFYSAKHKLKRIKSVANESCFKRASKEFKTQIAKAKKDFIKSMHNKLRQLKSANNKEFWNILSDDSNPVHTKIALETLFEHFKKLNSDNNQNTTDQNCQEETSSFDSLPFNNYFTVEELLKFANKLKNGRSSGLDSIVNEFIKYSPPVMISLLAKYFNLILGTGIIPSNWTLGTIIPIYKNKGDTNDPDNYRGITLLSCIGKFFTLLINFRLTDFLESNDLLGEEQAGFRAGYSTLDHIFTLHCLIEMLLKNKKRLYCAFIDYRKAFDTVDRISLWQKLISIGIQGKVLVVIKNMYANAKSCVQLNNGYSDFFSCNIGVRQGENLSPLLFSIFLNDLAEHMSKESNGINVEFSDRNIDCYIRLFVLLYADDTILVSETPEDLQTLLNSLDVYCNQWKMQINQNKSKIVIFSRGLVKKVPKWTLGSHTLEVTQDYIYLGVVYNYNGRFTKAIKKQINQARRASFSLMAKARKNKLPVDLQLHLFDTCILPILLYGCEIWGFSDLKDIELFHHQFCKYILRIGPRSINNIALGELGRFKIEKHIKQRMLNFWVHLACSEPNKISHIMYLKLLGNDSSDGYQSQWASHIKNTLRSLDLEHLWEVNPSLLHPNQLKTLFNRKLSQLYTQQWQNDIYSSTACDTYTIFKDQLQIEPYLTLLDPKFSIPISKFRSNNHRLPIVTGRYNRQDRLERLCTLCEMGDVGDEYHYLLRCSYFSSARQKFIKPDFIVKSQQKVTLKHIMNSKNPVELVNLSKFISLIMDEFKNK